jgi:anti-sigma factor RsiW
MGDMASRLSAEEMAELAALADGSLAPDRRAALEARVAASPELEEVVDRQRSALAATRAVAAEPAPASLRPALEERIRGRGTARRRSRLVPGLALGGAVAAIAAVVLVLVFTGAPGGPTVADAARLAASPPSGPAPARLDHSRAKLAAGVDGVVFPYLARPWGWRQVGSRHAEVDGRAATVVYYAKDGKRVGYAIVTGSALPAPSGAQTVERHGVTFRTVSIDGRPAVTWERLGHTCVLTGATSRHALLSIASWRGGGTLRY